MPVCVLFYLVILFVLTLFNYCAAVKMGDNQLGSSCLPPEVNAIMYGLSIALNQKTWRPKWSWSSVDDQRQVSNEHTFCEPPHLCHWLLRKLCLECLKATKLWSVVGSLFQSFFVFSQIPVKVICKVLLAGSLKCHKEKIWKVHSFFHPLFWTLECVFTLWYNCM